MHIKYSPHTGLAWECKPITFSQWLDNNPDYIVNYYPDCGVPRCAEDIKNDPRGKRLTSGD